MIVLHFSNSIFRHIWGVTSAGLATDFLRDSLGPAASPAPETGGGVGTGETDRGNVTPPLQRPISFQDTGRSLTEQATQ